jgi:hypothetical protein
VLLCLCSSVCAPLSVLISAVLLYLCSSLCAHLCSSLCAHLCLSLCAVCAPLSGLILLYSLRCTFVLTSPRPQGLRCEAGQFSLL